MTDKFLITEVKLKEVSEVSLKYQRYHRAGGRVVDLFPQNEDSETNMLEMEGSFCDSGVINLEYFTGKVNGLDREIYVGYTEVTEGALGFMFRNFKKQRENTARQEVDIETKKLLLDQAKGTIARMIRTEVLIKNTGFWCRLAYALTNNHVWLTRR